MCNALMITLTYSLLLIVFFNSFFFYFSSTPTSASAKINGQTTPLDVTGLSQNEIQGLLLGSHPSSQSINVKREPEDLRKEPKSGRSQKVSTLQNRLLYSTIPLIT